MIQWWKKQRKSQTLGEHSQTVAWAQDQPETLKLWGGNAAHLPFLQFLIILQWKKCPWYRGIAEWETVTCRFHFHRNVILYTTMFPKKLWAIWKFDFVPAPFSFFLENVCVKQFESEELITHNAKCYCLWCFLYRDVYLIHLWSLWSRDGLNKLYENSQKKAPW